MKAAEEGSRGRHAFCLQALRNNSFAWDWCLSVSQLCFMYSSACSFLKMARRARKENRDKAAAHIKAGNKQAAYECYQRAVDISPATAHDFAKVCASIKSCPAPCFDA